MSSENKVQRTFFVDPRVDSELSRLALQAGVSKNEYTRNILENGMKPFLAGTKALPPGMTHGPASDFGEGRDGTKVMRSIYLGRQFDDFLRSTAFEQRYSKSELMRKFIEKGLSQVRTAAPTGRTDTFIIGTGNTYSKMAKNEKKPVLAKSVARKNPGATKVIAQA